MFVLTHKLKGESFQNDSIYLHLDKTPMISDCPIIGYYRANQWIDNRLVNLTLGKKDKVVASTCRRTLVLKEFTNMFISTDLQIPTYNTPPYHALIINVIILQIM